MKKRTIGLAILLVQVLVILVLLAVPHLPVSHAVRWQVTGTQIQAAAVRGGDAHTQTVNQALTEYLDSYAPYYEQDILSFHQAQVLSSTPHLSVLEIQTRLKHNATVESQGEYLPAGEKTVQLWVYVNGDSVKTQWHTVSDTAEPLTAPAADAA